MGWMATRKALGEARQDAALNRVRVQELEEAMADLIEAVDALPPYHPLENPLFRDRLDRARRTLGVR